VLTNEDIQGASFAQVARNQCKYMGIANDDALLPNVKTTIRRSPAAQAAGRELDSWQAWRFHWQESLDKIAFEIRQGVASVTPMKSACMYCELKPLCRIGASSDIEESDDEVVRS